MRKKFTLDQQNMRKKFTRHPRFFRKKDAQNRPILANLQLTDKFISWPNTLSVNWKTQKKCQKTFQKCSILAVLQLLAKLFFLKSKVFTNWKIENPIENARCWSIEKREKSSRGNPLYAWPNTFRIEFVFRFLNLYVSSNSKKSSRLTNQEKVKKWLSYYKKCIFRYLLRRVCSCSWTFRFIKNVCSTFFKLYLVEKWISFISFWGKVVLQRFSHFVSTRNRKFSIWLKRWIEIKKPRTNWRCSEIPIPRSVRTWVYLYMIGPSGPIIYNHTHTAPSGAVCV